MAERVHMPPLFTPVFVDKRVALAPGEFREAAENIDEFLLTKLRKGTEGTCSTDGYVRVDSMKILSRSMGQAEHGRFTGDFIYYCKVRMECLRLTEGQVVDAQVLKANKMGAYAILMEGGQPLEAARVLLPREFHVGNAEFDALVPGISIKLRILRAVFQKNDAFIQAVGVLDTTVGGAKAALLPALLPAVVTEA